MMKTWLPATLLLFVSWPAAAQSSADADRERNERVADVLDALSLSAGSQVADIGAGRGFYTSRIAKKEGAGGRVYAVDIDDKEAIPKLKEIVEKQSLANVTVSHSDPGDPKLPDNSLDAALMVITYHEVEPYQDMLKHVMRALKPGGRFVVVDMTPHKTRSRPRADQTKNHTIAPEVAEQEFRAAGFEIASRRDDFVDQPDDESTRWIMICRRPVK